MDYFVMRPILLNGPRQILGRGTFRQKVTVRGALLNEQKVASASFT